MTTPTNQLADLSIAGRMASRSRTEAQRERRRREAEERRQLQESQANSISQLPAVADYGALEGASGLRYNVQSLPVALRSTAARGLLADNLDAERAKMHTLSARGPYTAFQMNERLRLCIYALPQGGRRVDCSCGEFASRQPKICSHIYWLYDRVNAMQPTSETTTIRSVNISDVETVLAQVLQQPAAGLDNLTEGISPSWGKIDDETDREVETLLSVFDIKRLPDEFDEDFYSNLLESETHNPADLVEPSNLFRTVFNLARHDRIFRERLQVAITQERTDKDLLRKLYKRKNACFEQLERYAKEGPALNTNQIAACRKALQEIIGRLSEQRQLILESPNPAFDRSSARIAIKILRDICEWNRDIYAKSRWLKVPPPASSRDRNLFVAFFADSFQTAESNVLTKFLCIELPTQVCIGSAGDVAEIVKKLRISPAPAQLVQTLEQFLQRLRAEPAPPLSVIENYHSFSSSSARSSRSGSTSSGSDSASEAQTSSAARRPSSALDQPELQRRRLH